MRRPSPTSAKRWTLKVALCLLAGAVITWGVAWGCALWGPLPYWWPGGRYYPDGVINWPMPVPASWPPAQSHGVERSATATYEVWVGGWERLAVRSYGWPRRSMDVVLASKPRMQEWGPDAIFLELPLRDDGSPRLLPTRFVPLGFALNTLFYAAVLLGVVEGVAFARRRVRRGNGRCPSCGYDRAGLAEGSACPECGALGGAAAG